MPITWILETALPWITSNFKLILIGVAIAALYFYGDHHGAARVKTEWQTADAKRKIAEDAALVTAQQNVIFQERKDNQITGGISNAYQIKLTTLDSAYGAAFSGLHTAGSGAAPGGVPGACKAQPGHNDAPRANQLPRGVQADILALMKAADVQTARLVSCQAWIAGHQAPSP